MAFAKRNYKKGGKAPAKTTVRTRAAKEPEEHKEPEAEPTARRGGFTGQRAGSGRGFGGGRRGGGGGYGGGKKQNADFQRITGLFPSKSGNSFQIAVKPEILDVLAEAQEGDYIGVSFATIKTRDGEIEGMSLWLSRPK